MKKKILIAAVLAFLAVLTLVSCSKDKPAESGDLGDSVMVQIEMQNGGIIKLELYPKAAPITVENFVNLVNEGFYDGLIFHRVIKDFMIQGGDPEGTGMGGSVTKIKGEFKQNGWDNASSQFFICHGDATYLDGQYAAFGKVTEGMDVVDEIASVPTDKNDRPVEDVVIKTIKVIEEDNK